MKADILNRTPPEKYKRNDTACVLDRVKHILRPATPEEDVRQKTICFLHEEMNIPYDAMDTEIPLMYFVKGQRGRMDIVVYGDVNNNRIPVMVVETKAPTVPLTDDVYLQAQRYAKIVKIPVLMVTNGEELDFQKWNTETNEYEQIIHIPTYEDILSPETIAAKQIGEWHYNRRSLSELSSSATIEKEMDYGYFLGAACNKVCAPQYLNLAECLLDNSHKIDNLNLANYKFIKDGGLRYTSFGNASGGSYPGMYRYIMVQDANNDVQIVSMAVMGCLNGRTLLIVAIDDFDKHHNSLQLSLDHFCNIHNNKMTLFHNGRMTVGKLGQLKAEKVRNYVLSKKSFEITPEGHIVLGTVDTTELMKCGNEDVDTLISNVVEYGLLRDELRKEVGK